MNNILAIFIGGGLGSLVRYGISGFTAERFKTIFPLATLASNILSCVILAATIAFLSQKADMNPTWKMFIITGFCGGFSTFSTFSYETVELIRSGNSMYAIANILLSVIVCAGLIFMIARDQPA
ncbi:MAG: fluoride efflux transporter CrcB [Bacteroidetes bacterium]|nr:fluoride efflux transporter CrcB [Bacteroidota bacterium]